MPSTVCFISSFFPPVSMGGVERYLLYVTHGLQESGYRSTVLTRYYPPLSRREQLPYCTVHRIGMNPIPYSTKRYVRGLTDTLASHLTYTVLGFPEAREIVRTCDVLHAQLGHASDVSIGARLAGGLRKRYVVTIHGRFGNETEDIPPKNSIFNMLNKADYLLVNRKESQNILREHGMRNIAYLQNPVPVSEFRHPAGSEASDRNAVVRVLFVGRLTYRRGAHLAIRGFTYAANRRRDIELWVVGSGDLASRLKSFIEKNGLQERVRFFGNQFDIRRFMWHSDVFLATSPIANSPSLALREAMAAGMAVLATDVEETGELIRQRESGILVPPSPDYLGRAILELVEDSELRQKLSRAAKGFAERNFDLSVHVRELAKIYESI